MSYWTHASLDTAGERLAIECHLPWVRGLIEDATAGELLPGCIEPDTSLRIRIESETRAFDVQGWELVSRGVWRQGRTVVVEDVCATGFDLLFECSKGSPRLTYRWRPRARSYGSRLLMGARFRLLARAALIQYPALWWASTRGRIPLHAGAYQVSDRVPLLVGGSGIGKSTLLMDEVAAGGVATTDNVCVSDGESVWGLVEPMRLESRLGRRTSHGRREQPLPGRIACLTPDCVVVLRRSHNGLSSLASCSKEVAACCLVATTYMAGELRRYWPFAATMSAASGIGPPHPAVVQVASTLAARLPCLEANLKRPGERLSQLLSFSAASA